MCRFVAYRGNPVLLEDIVCAPKRSLVHQSLYASEVKTTTNGDGYGLGWYHERPHPGVYREIRPAWSDENLRSICSQIRSHLFFAHVRASTGTATTRANCHPFTYGNHLFMHNGQIGGYSKIKRGIEALIPDELYQLRTGSTDSEAIFLAAIAEGLIDDPIGAMSRTLASVRRLMDSHNIQEALRFSAILSDGENLWAYRWACDDKPPTLYYCKTQEGLIIASEPIDDDKDNWKSVPRGSTMVARKGEQLIIEAWNKEGLAAA